MANLIALLPDAGSVGKCLMVGCGIVGRTASELLVGVAGCGPRACVVAGCDASSFGKEGE